MERPISRSQSIDERSVGEDVDGDLVRERSVHGGSRNPSVRSGAAYDGSRSIHGGNAARARSGSGNTNSGGDGNDGSDGNNDVELGHHHGLTVTSRPPLEGGAQTNPVSAGGGGGGGSDGVVVPVAATSAAAAAPGRQQQQRPKPVRFYLEEYDEDLWGAPLWAWPRAYFRKMRGGLDTPMPFPESVFFAVISTVGAFLGIAVVGGLDVALNRREILDSPVLLASFGASAVLLFSVPESKLSQPVNFIGGQMLSAAVGATVRLVLSPDRGVPHWITAAAGVSLAILAMMLTSTTHPPGGATALIAATAPRPAPWHGYRVVFSVGIGCVGMQVVALLADNLHRGRRYPSRWIGYRGLP